MLYICFFLCFSLCCRPSSPDAPSLCRLVSSSAFDDFIKVKNLWSIPTGISEIKGVDNFYQLGGLRQNLYPMIAWPWRGGECGRGMCAETKIVLFF